MPTSTPTATTTGWSRATRTPQLAFETVAIGCRKVVQSTSSLPFGTDESPNPNFLLNLVDLDRRCRSRRTVRRQFVDRAPLKQGLLLRAASPTTTASPTWTRLRTRRRPDRRIYYARDLKAPGIRFISLDTVSQGGTVQDSADGNVDDPQFQWLEGELNRAQAQNKLVVVFGHHPIRSLVSNTPDEAAAPCTTNDSHGHNANPGCDIDPRGSSPIHLGTDRPGAKGLATLLDEHPGVVAYVAGHTHENKVLACGSAEGCPARANWWEINTSAVADWPQQSRLIELMDNHDGTLSLFGTAHRLRRAAGHPVRGLRRLGLRQLSDGLAQPRDLLQRAPGRRRRR